MVIYFHLYTERWVLRKYGYFNPKIDNESGKNASLEGFEPTTSARLPFLKPLTSSRIRLCEGGRFGQIPTSPFAN
jgi:hypothetical protein